MANYYPIPLEEMDEVLRGYRFAPVDLTYRNRPVKEWVYERRLPQSPNHFVRVYTGVQRYGRYAGRSRKVGKDAIRVQVVYRDEKGETLVSQPKRVHRVDGWRENLQKRMNEISSTLPQVEFDTRGEPMTLRKHKGNYFWGSRDYPKYKETQPFRAEGDSQVIRFDTLEEFHNYIKNHQYSDVEDKKRRAYMLAESREEFQQFSQKQPVIVLDFDCYAMRNIWADKLGIAYNHVVPLSNVSFQNLDPRFIPHDLVNEYGAPQSATFDFNQDYQYLIERNIMSGRVHQNMNINLNGIPFTINWSWSSSPLFNLELWLWKIPLSSIENKDELNFKNVATLNPQKGNMWTQMQKRRELYAADEITLKEFDDTDVGRNSMFKNMDDKITFMLRKFSKINRHGDIGCPGCGSIGLFYSEPISKGRKWHCLSCLYEDKIESIKSRGDITLEKYGLLIECPLCEKPIKAYNQDSMNRHLKKCKEESS